MVYGLGFNSKQHFRLKLLEPLFMHAPATATCLLEVRRFFPHDRDEGGKGKGKKGKGRGKGKTGETAERQLPLRELTGETAECQQDICF